MNQTYLVALHDGVHSGPENMSRDSVLLANADQGSSGCRVYFWDGLWVSLGRFQTPERGLVDPNSTPWVKRPTGGKAVLHGWDLTVALAVPLAELPLKGVRNLQSVYRCTVRPIVLALQACGVDALLAADSHYCGSGTHSGDCFAFASPNDVVHRETGQKLCGCALRLTKDAVLVQASIPMRSPDVDPSSIIISAKALPVQPWDSSLFANHLTEAFSHGWEI
jgi:lipoate-protein ligase A